ncbi:RNA polymerase sigma factor [Nocardioides donggukensis]|uniref:RNA polymerase sigma factor n=1 Tax=Nocardioides donggukensis TaxID=2774019 RepID=UPI00191E2D93|nr:sigma-70 family RNA polymerase sigma factor [Nocardioides donggukensis]
MSVDQSTRHAVGPGPDPAAGDPDASTGRAELFGTYVEPEIEAMLRVAHRLTGSWNDAEDVVQDSLVRAYRAIDRFDGRHPRAWLFTIVRNTHLNSLRRTRPVPAEDEWLERRTPAFGADRAPSAEEVYADRHFDADVEAALAALDPRFRRVVLLVDLDHLTYAEAAEVLGVPVGTVMSRLSRARSRLREQLAHRRPGPDPTTDPKGKRR